MGEGLPALWVGVARAARGWLRERGAPERDAVLLVPYAALLAPARAAFAAGGGGWLPCIETPLTLAAALGPPTPAAPGQFSGVPALDALQAELRLRTEAAWPPAWRAHAAHLLVQAAQALHEAAAACAPEQRAAFWARTRARTARSEGPAALEAQLLAQAVEWAAGGAAPATDRLFALRPAAWIVLRLGGADALGEAQLGHADVPSLLLDADPPAEAPFAPAAPAALERWLCSDAEDEARAAASAVIEALAAGRRPLALVAVDREGVRRTRALLERAGVTVSDETGWRLSTTRAATLVLGVLRAAAPDAEPDDRLAWLTTWPRAEPGALRSLDARWRERRHVADPAAAARLERRAEQHLAPLATGRRSLLEWTALLGASLRADGSLAELMADAAGRQVLAALTIDLSGLPAAAAPAWQHAAAALVLDLGGFSAWVEATLDAAPFEPARDAAADVVLTPLARAVGRPFAQLVLAGADHQRLGAPAALPGLIGDALARELGLPDAAARRSRQRLALAQLLRAPSLLLIRRHHDADERLADSPDVLWLLQERAVRGAPPCPLVPPPRHGVACAPAPVPAPLPRAANALPAALSATQVGALRQCPYRFFALAVLRLEEVAELDEPLGKRDYGNWLHLALHRFHADRKAGGDDVAALHEAARQATAALGLDEGELLPFRASFEAFVPAYLAWLHAREGEGWHWAAGEDDQRAAPGALAPTTLRGRIDRIDQGPGAWRRVFDYKTGAIDRFREAVADPLEDTQLAFYAALLGADPKVSAAYLVVDGAKAPVEIEHLAVHQSATTLIEGLGGELARLRAGVPLPALGEGTVCQHCEARGLCRRDHWSAA
jgi:ATP-dependent helicase/nuclease subunit B